MARATHARRPRIGQVVRGASAALALRLGRLAEPLAPVLNVGLPESFDERVGLFHFRPSWSGKERPAVIFDHCSPDGFIILQHEIQTTQVEADGVQIWIRIFRQQLQAIVGGRGPGNHCWRLGGKVPAVVLSAMGQVTGFVPAVPDDQPLSGLPFHSCQSFAFEEKIGTVCGRVPRIHLVANLKSLFCLGHDVAFVAT